MPKKQRRRRSGDPMVREQESVGELSMRTLRSPPLTYEEVGGWLLEELAQLQRSLSDEVAASGGSNPFVSLSALLNDYFERVIEDAELLTFISAGIQLIRRKSQRSIDAAVESEHVATPSVGPVTQTATTRLKRKERLTEKKKDAVVLQLLRARVTSHDTYRETIAKLRAQYGAEVISAARIRGWMSAAKQPKSGLAFCVRLLSVQREERRSRLAQELEQLTGRPAQETLAGCMDTSTPGDAPSES